MHALKDKCMKYIHTYIHTYRQLASLRRRLLCSTGTASESNLFTLFRCTAQSTIFYSQQHAVFMKVQFIRIHKALQRQWTMTTYNTRLLYTSNSEWTAMLFIRNICKHLKLKHQMTNEHVMHVHNESAHANDRN
jgi:hypothetical protein